MTLCVVMQGAIFVGDIFEGDPYPTHETLWDGVEVYHVGVGILLCAYGEIQRLKRQWFSLIEQAQLFVDGFEGGQPAYVLVEFPGVLYAAVDAGLAEVWCECFDDPGGHCQVYFRVKYYVPFFGKLFDKCFILFT